MARKKTTVSKNTKTENNIPLVNVKFSEMTSPKVNETSHGDWIEYGTEELKNLYPQFLIDIYNNSPTHSAIVNATAQMIAGRGFVIENQDIQNAETLSRSRQFMNKVNRNGETLHDVWSKLSHDIKLQGSFAVNVIWSKDKTKIAELYHVPVEHVRAGKVNEQGKVANYWISADWSQYRKSEFEPRPVASFNVNDRSESSQLYYGGIYTAGQEIYSAPDYRSAVPWIVTDKLTAEFHMNNIANGFAPSMWINFNNGIPTQEERFQIENSIQQKMTGVQSAGSFVLTFSDDATRKPDIQPIQQSDADKQFVVLNELTIQNLFISHRVTSPQLLGVKTEGQLGGRNELQESFELYMNTVVEPFQLVLMSFIDKVMKTNHMNVDLSVEQVKPINSRFGTDVLKDVLTVDEIRAELGFEPLPKQEETVEQENTELTVELADEKCKKKDGSCDDCTCQQYDMTDDIEEELLHRLDDIAQVVNVDEWEEIHESVVEDLENEDENMSNVELASIPYIPKGNNRIKTDWGDSMMFRVLYRYTGKLKNNSRKFCIKMVDNAQTKGYVYRKEDIDKLSTKPLNKGFGAGGSDTYDIFLWKGGVNCGHHWSRVVYMRRRVPKDFTLGYNAIDENGNKINVPAGELLPATVIKNYKKSTQKALQQAGVFIDDKLAQTKPKDMTNKGRR
jgi:hypothetical protein